MREFLFKGKRVDNGEWVYGFLFMTSFSTVKTTGLVFCIQEIEGINYKTYEVIPETVGQYTGLTDKNGKKIFEGDIVRKMESDFRLWEKNNFEGEEPFVIGNTDIVTMDRFPLYWLEKETFGYEGEDLQHHTDYEVIGNIYDKDKPELLK